MKWIVSHPEKIVSFLQSHMKGFSGKHLRRILETNACRVNGCVERFGTRSLQKGDVVEMLHDWKKEPIKALAIATIYEDEEIKVINKPMGWVCSDQQLHQSFGADFFLVHRLDKDTTGLLLLAKNRMMERRLMALFANREIHKTYLAIVDGVPKETCGVCSSLLAKKGSFHGQTIWGSTVGKGLEAITHWQCLKSTENTTLIQCIPETGRTHQIRVHMAEMGHPLIIDRQYAKQYRSKITAARPLLHAHKLSFSLGEKVFAWEAPIPSDFIVE